MHYRLILILLIFFAAMHAHGQDVNYTPKSLEKDLHKVWGIENIQLTELQIPDSVYNDMLLDKGKIYSTTIDIDQLGYVYIGRIYSCRSGGCSVAEKVDILPVDEDYEYFDYYIIFDRSLTVKKIRVYNYQATHGHEVSGKGWLKQFVGYHGDTKLEYGKNIDSISGATISANAITYNVQESYRYLNLLQKIITKCDPKLKVQQGK